MNATILPSDEMIHVLSDAIASKRATIELMERVKKEATEDLQRLRQARAIHLARASGIEVGQVWVMKNYRVDHKPCVVIAIKPAYGDGGEQDFRIEARLDVNHVEGCAGSDLVGKIEPSCYLHERMTKLAAEAAEKKEKAA